MEKFLEEEASFYRPSGSTYIKLSPTFMRYIGIIVEDKTNNVISDAKICLAKGKHGSFVFIYSPEQQRKYQKEQRKRAKQGGE